MKKILTLFFAACLLIQQTGSASPWSEGKNYSEKTGGKAVFGVKNTLLGWTAIFTETIKYEYHLEKKKGWEGFCVGIAKSVLYTATGAIHLVTFPIPVDFPNMGEGVLHSSVKEQAEREEGKKQTPKVDSTENEIQSLESDLPPTADPTV
ncbi:MAG TPA: hypothetical protein PLY88_07755 [Candidatus Omnitrophota bacterium]|nr:hypothetical protein [Candidatus Omnitrophota bacterium]HRK62424.1 hypothetical protein [Candidatus Omnitrophota bacterium]